MTLYVEQTIIALSRSRIIYEFLSYLKDQTYISKHTWCQILLKKGFLYIKARWLVLDCKNTAQTTPF